MTHNKTCGHTPSTRQSPNKKPARYFLWMGVLSFATFHWRASEQGPPPMPEEGLPYWREVPAEKGPASPTDLLSPPLDVEEESLPDGRRDQPQKTVSPHKDRELLSAISIAGNKRSLTHLAQSSSFQMKERLWCLGPSSFPSPLCTGGNRHHKWLLYKLGSPLFSTNSTQEATNNSKISLIERSRTTAMQWLLFPI